MTALIKLLTRLSLFLALLLAASWILGWNYNVMALLAGLEWGIVNFYLLTVLSVNILLTKRYLYTIVVSLIKFPISYWIGYQLLQFDKWDPWYLVYGLSLSFVVVIAKALRFQFARTA